MNFGEAVAILKQGGVVARSGWNGPNQSLRISQPGSRGEGEFDMTLPYLYITTVQGDRVPWLASQTDILAEDWFAP